MQVTQNYARPSSARMESDGLRLDVSSELSRPTVALTAVVKDSLSYSRLMLALYAVVSGDHRPQEKDHSAYQAWVQQRYLEELSLEMTERMQMLPGMLEQRKALKDTIAEVYKLTYPLEAIASGTVFEKAKRQYFSWLLKHNSAAWMILDPVVSVHPDSVIFEVFSIDESSYGRVTVPMDKLDTFGTTVYGTTNIDFSKRLADEISRVRNYRPAWLQIGGEGVTIATGAGEAVEKKIDLPPSWVRGFLQVQSAAAFGGIDVTFSASTIAEVLAVLQRQREDKGPRSLRFKLTHGELPSIVIEPWNIEIKETTHRFLGQSDGDVRIWGRRRLLVLESLLPYSERVQIRLLGTGMPSYWTVFQQDHRIDIGLSGWTKNDWSRSARFDLLASSGTVSAADLATTAEALKTQLRLKPEELAAQTGWTRDAAASALQSLCRDGRAMFDLPLGIYRWRQLLPFPNLPDDEDDQRLVYARRLVALGAVKWLTPTDEDTFGRPNPDEPMTRYKAQVRGETRGDKKFTVKLELDADGRVRFAWCDCSWHRREKLRKGPCAHILATSALASQQSVAAKSASTGTAQSVLNPNRFKGETYVFTGALSLFTREQAEAVVTQGGGRASSSVSKNTTCLVAGERAGSKLEKARELGVKVMTEQEFKAILDGEQA